MSISIKKKLFQKYFIFLFRLKGGEILKQNNCWFLGDVEFTDNCQIAVHKLREIAPEFLDELLENEKVIIYHISETFMDFRNQIYSIGKMYAVWGDVGVVVFLVYIYYRNSAVENAEAMTANWLSHNNFPSALVESFEGT